MRDNIIDVKYDSAAAYPNQKDGLRGLYRATLRGSRSLFAEALHPREAVRKLLVDLGRTGYSGQMADYRVNGG